MAARRCIPVLVALAAATVARADAIDGTMPLECKAEKGHDCLPTENQCTRLKPESNQPPVIGIDFAKGEVRTPYRDSVLRVDHSTTNAESLVLQGADLLFSWTATVNKATGALTVSIADRKGAYVVFGTCKVAKKT